MYNPHNTQVIITQEAVINGWCKDKTGMWQVALVPVVSNVNINTVDQPPTEFLPDQPLPTKAIHNVYELKAQPELVRYHHATAGYPTEPTWIKAIKNKQFASWPGLTVEAVQIYYPELEETHKGHGRKKRSGLRSTKKKQVRDKEEKEFMGPRPTV
jgi:hypothetical protein